MEMHIILVLLIIIIVGIYYLSSYAAKRKLNFPPGPKSLPLIGNMLDIGSDLHVLAKWSKTYGPIVGYRFGRDRAICLHGAKLIKDALDMPELAGRLSSEALSYIFGRPNGISQASGRIWMEQRRFAIRHLRDFGFGKRSIESSVMSDVKDFHNWLESQTGDAVNIQKHFVLAVFNSLWFILTGQRFKHGDPTLHAILEDMERSYKASLEFSSWKSLLVFFLPELAKLVPEWSGWNELDRARQPREYLFKKIIDEHNACVLEHDPMDFIDVHLLKIRKTTDPYSSFHPSHGKESLLSVLSDFFVAGTDTTAVTLTWICLHLVLNAHVLRKLQQELDLFDGKPWIKLEDRPKLPYTEAVILETLRITSIVPFSAPRVTLQDISLNNYDIPKGTIVFSNLYANHRDPEVWGIDADEFKPERFLSPDGSRIIRHEAFLPFSTGKRVCIGEAMARDSLFLFTSNLFKTFQIQVADREKYPTLDFKLGQLTLHPVCNTFSFKIRSN